MGHRGALAVSRARQEIATADTRTQSAKTVRSAGSSITFKLPAAEMSDTRATRLVDCSTAEGGGADARGWRVGARGSDLSSGSGLSSMVHSDLTLAMECAERYALVT
jgi:hypothetical protein